MEKKYSCYGNCRRCLYQPQVSNSRSKEPSINIGCDDPRHKLGNTTPAGFEIAHWVGQPDKRINTNVRGKGGQDVSTKRSKGKRVVDFGA